MADIIWEATLDGEWLCKVVRTGERTGKLTIEHQGSVAAPGYEAEVPLAYGAQFGPDVSDVQDWQDVSVKWVDAQSEKSQEDDGRGDAIDAAVGVLASATIDAVIDIISDDTSDTAEPDFSGDGGSFGGGGSDGEF